MPTTPATDELPRPDALRLPFRLSVALVVLTVVVILFGAMTTGTGSGLAFADWPLSDGELMPDRAFTEPQAFLEHFHRVLASCAGLLSVVICVLVFRASGSTKIQRRLALSGLILISVQGVIGGIGVLELLPRYNSATHGTLAQVTISVFAAMAYQLSSRRAATKAEPHSHAGSGRVLAMITLVLLIVQAFLGAVARHSPPGEGTHALWSHVGNAVIVFLVIIITLGVTARLEHIPGLKRLGQLGMGFLMVQVSLGFIALLVRRGKDPENIEYLWRAALISSHVLVGALLTVLAALVVAHVRAGTRLDS